MKYILLFMLTFFSAIVSFAEGSQLPIQSTTNSNFMIANGKIMVVMAVVVVIVVGLFLYLFFLDRKISKMERKA